MLQPAVQQKDEKPGDHTGPWTWQDFLALEEDDLRELIDGHLVQIDMPTNRHEYAVATMVAYLGGWALPRKAGWVLTSGYKVRISQKRGVMPDVQFYRRDNPSKRQDLGLSAGHPDLAMEVVSRTSRKYDRVTKLNWYASIGVPEYWIVDPRDRTLVRQVLREGHYLTVEALEDDAIFRPDSFPGLEIPLAILWDAGTAEEGEEEPQAPAEEPTE